MDITDVVTPNMTLDPAFRLATCCGEVATLRYLCGLSKGAFEMTVTKSDYFRRDQAKGITPPELSKDCSYAEHIVRTRGKRTRFTSVSLERDKITDFGPSLYVVLRKKMETDGHDVIEHSTLMLALRTAASSSEKGDRLRAIQAQRYATKRKEGLIEWRLDISRVDRKDLFQWTSAKVEPYFAVLKNG